MKRITKALTSTLLIIASLAIMIASLFGYRDIPLEDLKEKYAQGASSFVSMDGMEVHYRDQGNAADSLPIVLIHGTGSSLHTFDEWTKELKQDHRVIRMDLPGYGLTGPFPNRDYSINAYVGFIKHFLDEKGIDSCILGGNSLGGQISWQFTVQHPDMVRKLILIDAAGYPSQAESVPLAFRLATMPLVKNLLTFITPKSIATASVENVYADKSKATDAIIDRYFELTLRPGNRQAFVDRFSANRDPEAYKQIPNIHQPTMVLWGDQDRLIPVANAERFHGDLPNDTLVVLEQVGHVPMEESPEESLEAVKAFLDGF